MAALLSSEEKQQAHNAAAQAMNVQFQLEKLEAEKDIFYTHLVETRNFLRDELIHAIGKAKLDGWIVCGSGLASLPNADGVTVLHRIAVSDIPHWFSPQAPGHGKEVLFADIGGQLVGIATGRAHLYDTNYSPSHLKMITAPLRVAKGLGAVWLVTTNAAGANDNGKVQVGDMVIDIDYVNQHGVNALFGPNDDRLGQRFPAKAQTADSQLTAKLAAIVPQERLHIGMYTLASNAPMYEGIGDLVRGSYRELIEQNANLVELHGMSFALEAMVMQHFNQAAKNDDGFDRQVHWIGLTAVTNVIPSVQCPTIEELIAKSVENPNPTSEQEVLEGAKIAEKEFIPAIIKLAEAVTLHPLAEF